uniref:Uncharacterized protein n=1 Tax=Arundo donax TaxID=35708 RepID=A0A0A9BF54_ARUDO
MYVLSSSAGTPQGLLEENAQARMKDRSSIFV